MTILLHILVGLVAIIAGLALLAFAVLGRVPYFVGPAQAIPQAVATYWKGRLACLVGGPLLIVIGCCLAVGSFSNAKARNLQEDFDEAMKLGKQGDLNGSMKAFDRALKNADEPVVVYAAQASILNLNGDTSSAMQQLAKAIQIDPAFSWAYALQSLIYLNQNNLTASRAAADLAIKQKDPNYSEQSTSRRARFQADGRSLGLYIRGLVNNEEHQYKSAIADLDSFLRRTPPKNERISAEIVMSVAYRNLRDYPKAAQAAQNAIKFDVKNPQGYLMLGLAIGGRGKWTEARKQFEQYVRLSSDQSEACNDIAWSISTNANPDCLQSKMAVEYAEKAVTETRRQKAGYLNTLAASYARDGRFKDAIRVEKEALALKDSQDYRQHLTLYEAGKAFTREE